MIQCCELWSPRCILHPQNLKLGITSHSFSVLHALPPVQWYVSLAFATSACSVILRVDLTCVSLWKSVLCRDLQVSLSLSWELIEEQLSDTPLGCEPAVESRKIQV